MTAEHGPKSHRKKRQPIIPNRVLELGADMLASSEAVKKRWLIDTLFADKVTLRVGSWTVMEDEKVITEQARGLLQTLATWSDEGTSPLKPVYRGVGKNIAIADVLDHMRGEIDMLESDANAPQQEEHFEKLAQARVKLAIAQRAKELHDEESQS